jgi:hypothetical protein
MDLKSQVSAAQKHSGGFLIKEDSALFQFGIAREDQRVGCLDGNADNPDAAFDVSSGNEWPPNSTATDVLLASRFTFGRKKLSPELKSEAANLFPPS